MYILHCILYSDCILKKWTTVLETTGQSNFILYKTGYFCIFEWTKLDQRRESPI